MARRRPAPKKPLFQTQRKRVIGAYAAARQPFNAGTKPYKSSLPFTAQTFDPQNDVAGAEVAYLVFKKGQIREFFGYGLGDSIPTGHAVPFVENRRALESDTNLSKGRSTNGAEDYIIEAISASHKGTRICWEDFGVAGLTDADVIGAYTGGIVVYDPGALMMPAQVSSPFNLEDAIFEAIKPSIQVEFEWDRGRVVKIGTLDEIPEGGAKSYLRASGDPRTDNRYKVPEGYLWRRDGQPDSEFIVRCTLAESVVIPISPKTKLNGLPAEDVPKFPISVAVDVTMRLHGMSVNMPSQN